LKKGDCGNFRNSNFNLFSVDTAGAGPGKPEVTVNGGKVSCHVATSSSTSTQKFVANFIPSQETRHRIDVKFNGEKVQQSPIFVEVSLGPLS
jgi:hypothetical protein